MKTNQLVRAFLCLLLILGLQGRGQGKDATSAEKTSSVTTTNQLESGKASENPYMKATTNEVVSEFAQLKARAEQGDAKAQNNLGVCYEHGNGVPQDLGEAVKWYRKAAEQNDATAQNNLGICYANGLGVVKDEAEAVKWCRKAADQNLADAQYNLGICYAKGLGVVKDEVEAVKWYRKAAEQNYATAQFDLGCCYAKGRGVAKDAVEAVKWYRKAADRNFAPAQYNLSYCYRDGQGVEKRWGRSGEVVSQGCWPELRPGSIRPRHLLRQWFRRGEG